MINRLSGRLALITGATSGIGKAIATRYAQEGANLVLVGRSTEALEALDDELDAYDVSRVIVPLDLRKFGAIEEMGAAIEKRFGRLDILIGNAGLLGTLGPIAQQEFDIWQEVLDVNLTANWQLIKSFDPLLKASDAGRAIFVSSGVTKAICPYWNAYSVSKVALENLVQLYAAESTKTSLKINLVDPGAVRTKMRAKAYPGEDPDTLPAPEEITDLFVELASKDCEKNGEVLSARN